MAATANHTERAHAKFAPSSMERTVACPAWVRLARGKRQRGSTVFSNEGSAAHELCDICLTTGRSPAEFDGQVIDLRESGDAKISDDNTADGFNAFRVDGEMIEGVQLYLDTIKARAGVGVEISVEERVDLTFIDPECWGTGDAVLYDPERRHLTIVDFKYGKAKTVAARKNIQLATYAVGAAHRLHNRGVDTLELVIVQPRAHHPEGFVRTYDLEFDELAMFEREIRQAIEKTRDPTLEPVAGEHCAFCPNADDCPAYAKMIGETCGISFGSVTDEDMDLPAVPSMSSKQLGQVWVNASKLTAWVAAVKRRCTDEALAGTVPEGTKLVAARQTRKFKDPVEARAVFDIEGLTEDQYTVVKLVTPAALEKRLGKVRASEILQGLLDTKPAGLTLVDTSDKRPSVTTPGAAFGVVPEEE